MEDKNTIDDLRSILDAIPYDITVRDLEGNYKYCNKKFLQILNFNSEEKFVNRNIKSVFDEDNCKEIRSLEEEVLNKNKGDFFERCLRRINDKERWFNIYKAPIMLNNEKSILTLSREVTFNKEISNLMDYELEKDSKDIFGYHDIMYNCNENGNVSDDEYNDRIKLLCKSLINELEAEYINIYLYNQENNSLNLYVDTKEEDYYIRKNIEFGTERFEKFTDSKVIINYPLVYNLFDKDEYELKIYEIKYGNNIIGIMNIYYEKNSVVKFEQNDLIKSTCYKFGLIFQNRIISRKLREEEAKKIKYKQALDEEMMKTEFFAGVSHEIRTPLNIILTATQLITEILNDCTFDKKDVILKNISYIKQNSKRLMRLMNNIIDINKIEAGYNSIHYSNINIVELVEDIVLSVADYIKLSGRNVIFDTEEEEIILACDEEKIERIMLNLLSNAIKYSYENTDIIVKIKLDRDSENVIISVWDDGISIDNQDCERIFGKSVQLNRLLNRPCEGSGLGLYLSKLFVELHKGNIWVNNHVDNGVEFDFTLPIKTIKKKNVYNYNFNKEEKVEECSIEFSDIYSL
ncbi:PAS domain-containing sensor histidine kinase [uncultured Clostridium sp.]|uniref:sensor histidine kinase n=1 Tax=uncultured Clostridium sp. TaxID=59620 RepID=UPI0025D7EC7C|nr:PAS domain-containing sensor histidine kinase [uncultured Clostridium sp.]